MQPTAITYANRASNRWSGAGDGEQDGPGVDGKVFELGALGSRAMGRFFDKRMPEIVAYE